MAVEKLRRACCETEGHPSVTVRLFEWHDGALFLRAHGAVCAAFAYVALPLRLGVALPSVRTALFCRASGSYRAVFTLIRGQPAKRRMRSV